jgi:hypothetical protein
MLEALEDRLAPAVITVTSTGDTIATDGLATLREAITSINNQADVNGDVTSNRMGNYASQLDGTPDMITFSIPGSGVQTIAVTGSALPTISSTVTIDGTGSSGTPLIELDGASAGSGANGLVLDTGSNGSTIEGLVINSFSGDGILVGSSGNYIQGNYIGTDASGTAALGNGSGIFVRVGSNTIGGLTSGLGNLISGNQTGIDISGDNQVQGNRIGTDVTGMTTTGSDGKPLGNGTGITIGYGISTGVLIGGTTAAARNIISGNGLGISDLGGTLDRIEGNYIGTDITGENLLGNDMPGNGPGGVWMFGRFGPIFGGPDPGDGNVIADYRVGVRLFNDGNVVQGNLIGTDATGTKALSDAALGAIGVYIPASGNNVIGVDPNAPLAGGGNTISGNATGISLGDAGQTSGNKIEGNYIGTDANGTAALGDGTGVFLNASATGNTVGGTTAAERNLVSGNGGDGIAITGSTATGNVIEGNYIGTDATGTYSVANGRNGINLNNTANNIIGGTAQGAGNLISGNSRLGISIGGSSATGNFVEGNYIGTDVTGTQPLGNRGSVAVMLLNAPQNTIGGLATGAGNLIMDNYGHGVADWGAGSVGNVIQGNVLSGNGVPNNGYATGISIVGASGAVVQGNYIGTDPTGRQALGNNAHGIEVVNSANNTIGGTDAATRNVISGNRGYGITFEGAAPSGNLVQGNFIGTDVTGTVALPNGSHGVHITGPGAAGNRVQGNVISGNGDGAVRLDGGATGNFVQGNFIGTDRTGTASLANQGFAAVAIIDSPGNTIGGTDAATRNVISGNSEEGIAILGSGSTGNVVQGNYIGTDATGTVGLGNAGDGVIIYLGASNTTIGGTAPGAGNVISGNAGSGVSSGELAYLAPTGTVLVENNIISRNRGSGVREGGGVGNVIQGDCIVGNGDGVEATGGDYLVSGCTISGNSGPGLVAVGTVTVTGCTISGNSYVGGFGGGIGNLGGTMIVSSCTISGNSAGVDGGGIFNFEGGTMIVSSCTISGNSATVSGGGIYNDLNGTLTVDDNSTVCGNQAPVGADLENLGVVSVYDSTICSLDNQNTGSGGVTFYASNTAHAQDAANVIAQVTAPSVNGAPVPITITLNLAQGTYQDLTLSTQANVTLVVNGVNGSVGTVNGTTVVGNSPAVTVTGGNVTLVNLSLTTATAAPTLLVRGGDVTLRNDIVQSSTGSSEPAIAVSGGSTVDLGTAASPGGNTILVNGGGQVLVSTGPNLVTAVGNTFQANGTAVFPVATTALVSSVNPSLPNQPITFTAIVSSPNSGSATPTGTVTFLNTTTGASLAVVTLSGGKAQWTSSALALGSQTITAIYSGDTNYITNFATLVQQIHYGFSGYVAPLSSNLAIALGRTVPIKFQLTDYNGPVSSLAAIVSLNVLNAQGTNVLTTAGSTALRYDPTTNQFVANWQTKGLPAGTYTVQLVLADGTTKSQPIQLVASSGAAKLEVDGSGTATASAGALLGGDVTLYVDNANGDLSADELARIQDAVTAVDAVTEPYGVAVQEVSDPTQADVTLNMATTSAVGGYADGVLGCTTDAGQITIINGWNFYAGSDATQIGATQYDFETVVTHELGHALGLGHSSDSTSVMYATLNAGAVNRSLTTADLNVPDTASGACGLHADLLPTVATDSTAPATTPVSDKVAAPAVPGATASPLPAAAVRADGVGQASLVLTTAVTTSTVLPASVLSVPAPATVDSLAWVPRPATSAAGPTSSMTSRALPSAGEVSTDYVETDDLAVPEPLSWWTRPAQDSAGPARAVRLETPATSEDEGPVALPAAALDAYFVDESSSSGQEVRTVETRQEQGPALVASAGLALGWMGLWRRDGTLLQPSTSRVRRRALKAMHKGDA